MPEALKDLKGLPWFRAGARFNHRNENKIDYGQTHFKMETTKADSEIRLKCHIEILMFSINFLAGE